MTDPAVCPAVHHHDQDRPRPSLDGLRLCQGHRDGLAEHLRQAGPLWGELAPLLTRADVLTGDKVSGSAANPGLSLNETVVRAREGLRVTLATWAGMVTDERGLTGPRSTDPPATGPFLARHVDWLAAHPTAADAAEEIGRVVRRAQAAKVPPARRFPVGPCVAVTTSAWPSGQEQLCPGQLEAVLRGGSMDREADLRCDTCGDATPHGQWLEKYVPPSQRGRRAG